MNYTGITCTNCRYMEGAVFPRPEIAALLRPMVMVELYTDRGTEADDANRADQLARFGTAALPLYSVERADGTVLGSFASSTNDPAEFERFLRDALAKAAGVLVAEPTRAKPAALAGEGGAAVSPLVLRTRRLADGAPEPALVPGRWTLINFWASYCSPCIAELKTFLVARGHALEAQGGRFVTVAIEGEDGLPKARELVKGFGLASSSALFLSDEAGPGDLDPRFGFEGALPYTVLVAPNGEVVWRHSAALEEPELNAKLACWIGDDPKPAADRPWVPEEVRSPLKS